MPRFPEPDRDADDRDIGDEQGLADEVENSVAELPDDDSVPNLIEYADPEDFFDNPEDNGLAPEDDE